MSTTINIFKDLTIFPIVIGKSNNRSFKQMLPVQHVWIEKGEKFCLSAVFHSDIESNVILECCEGEIVIDDLTCSKQPDRNYWKFCVQMTLVAKSDFVCRLRVKNTE